jgi:hypothetical protein
MVDVPDRPYVDVRFAAVKFLLRHFPKPFSVRVATEDAAARNSDADRK